MMAVLQKHHYFFFSFLEEKKGMDKGSVFRGRAGMGLT